MRAAGLSEPTRAAEAFEWAAKPDDPVSCPKS